MTKWNGYHRDWTAKIAGSAWHVTVDPLGPLGERASIERDGVVVARAGNVKLAKLRAEELAKQAPKAKPAARAKPAVKA